MDDQQHGAVRVGSWVEVRDGQLQEFWRIVPAHEADAMRRMISESSPLARALLGHRPGDRVSVDGPGRGWPVEVVSVGA
jgi:transcription elongation factor GreA